MYYYDCQLLSLFSLLSLVVIMINCCYRYHCYILLLYCQKIYHFTTLCLIPNKKSSEFLPWSTQPKSYEPITIHSPTPETLGKA